ncbi:unnamed protein product [Peniophora sp. CBMAI 1063]|nr:unnamed protein product [Peniophora sp. CBMAI 1063]
MSNSQSQNYHDRLNVNTGRPLPRAPSQSSQGDEQPDDGRDDVSVISAVRPMGPLDALPEIPASELDLSLSLDSILGSSADSPATEKVQKRASNVLKLAEENEKLKAELRAMTERLEAAERKRKEIEQRRTQPAGQQTSA